MQALPHIQHHTDWLFVLLFLCGAALVAARWNAPKRFAVLAALPLHTKRMEFIEDFKPFHGIRRFETLMSINAYLLLALGIFVVYKSQQGARPFFGDYVDFVRILFFVLLFFLGKALINALIEWMYQYNGQLTIASNINLSYRVWMSVFILPLVVFSVFVPSVSWILGLLLAFFMTIGYLQALIQSNILLWKIPAPGYLKFLYICALEIMPILFLIKWLF